jgi:hypothetical protein
VGNGTYLNGLEVVHALIKTKTKKGNFQKIKRRETSFWEGKEAHVKGGTAGCGVHVFNYWKLKSKFGKEM